MIDPLLLRSFLLIAAGNSFSETSRRLSLRQSTVSDHIRKLEATLGVQLFTRDTHSVALTPQGEALIPFAQDILEAHERARRRFSDGGAPSGRLRFGLSCEIGATRLMPVLRDFAVRHAAIEVEAVVAPAGLLRAGLACGEIDLAVIERWPGESDGEPLWREELAFVRDRSRLTAPPPPMPLPPWLPPAPEPPVLPSLLPLVLPPAPSLTRTLTLAALDGAGHPWRIGCTAPAGSGARAAVAAGLGIGVLPDEPLPPGLAFVESELPPIEPLPVAAHRGRAGDGAGELLRFLRARLCED